MLRNTFSYGGEAIVEAYIEGIELTVGIVKNKALPVVQIQAPNDLYDYTAKYTKGKTKYLVPAPIDDELAYSCQALALRVFNVLSCRSFGRIDLRVSESGEAHVLEMNTIPGFTETSLLPKAASASGIEFPELCAIIMNTAKTS